MEASRFFLIFFVQGFIVVFYFFMAFKILKRNRNRTTLTISLYYFFIGTGCILNIVLVLVEENPLTFILYFMAIYFIIFSQTIIFVFIGKLLTINLIAKSKKTILLIFSYGFLVFLILSFPGGITINQDTDWKPVYSWSFLISLYIFHSVVFIIPTIVLLKKLYDKLEIKKLKKKLKYFSFGYVLGFFAQYGAVLYNTWDNSMFKLIWSVLSFISVVTSGFLMYYGIVYNL